MDLATLINELVEHGGALVTSQECSEIELADARVTNRFAVDHEGIGYVRRTKEWLALQKSRESRATFDKILRMLNGLLVTDAKAVAKLIELRVPASLEFEKHPHVTVYGAPGDPDVELGLLGILNGITGLLTGRRLIAFYGLNDDLTHFAECVTPPTPIAGELSQAP